MRDYGRIRNSFWSDEKISAVSSAAKLLAAYLMTCQHTNAIGCFRAPIGYVVADLGLPDAAIAAAFTELSDIGFILRDPQSGWILLTNYLKHNPLENPKVGIACARMAASVPDSFTHLAVLLEKLRDHSDKLPEGFLEKFGNRIDRVSEARSQGIEMVPKPSRNIEPYPYPYPEPSSVSPSGETSGVAAQAAPGLPRIEPKAYIFGECLRWFMATGKPEKEARNLIGKWCSVHGNAKVITAFQAASRDPPAGDATQWLTAILQERDPNARSGNAAQQNDRFSELILEGVRLDGSGHAA